MSAALKTKLYTALKTKSLHGHCYYKLADRQL